MVKVVRPFASSSRELLHHLLALVVQGRGGLVQNQDRRVFQENPGDADPLLLPSGELYAPLAHIGVIPLGAASAMNSWAPASLAARDDLFPSGAPGFP